MQQPVELQKKHEMGGTIEKNVPNHHFLKAKAFVFWTLLISVTLIIFLVSFSIGYYDILPLDVLKIMISRVVKIPVTWQPQMEIIVLHIRFPRIIAAMLVGSALSIAGASYQGMLKNPLAAPDILGVSQGAGFGAALAITMGMGVKTTQLMAFIFGLAVVGIAYALSSRIRYGQVISLILSGALLGTLCSSGITMLKYIADTNDTLPAITYWLMGSLAAVDFNDLQIAIVPIFLGSILLMALRWRMNALTLEDEEAMSMGVNARRLRLIVIIGATMVSAAAVCVGGIIGWVGLIVPHVVRKFTGPDFRKLLPGCFFGGACFLLIVDNIARSVSGMEIPLGVLTSLVGAPFVLSLILCQKGE